MLYATLNLASHRRQTMTAGQVWAASMAWTAAEQWAPHLLGSSYAPNLGFRLGSNPLSIEFVLLYESHLSPAKCSTLDGLA